MYEHDVIMPFGKYKGLRISEVPIKYLDWLIGQDWMHHRDLRLDIEAYLEGCAEWKRMQDD